MSISSINPAASGAIHQARTDESEDVLGTRRAQTEGTAAGGERDALEIQAGASESSELTAARAALKASDNLDPARRSEIQARIQSGFYSQPDTIEKVAGAMADALQSSKGSE
ncbi:MAG: hypothetical protein ACI9W4_000721 [Rhodothermales bacterium]|jgi:hypothetical protein